jgi:hypothetical protein
MNFENSISNKEQVKSTLDKKIGVAKTLSLLDTAIRENPKIDIKELLNILDGVAQKYVLNNNQIDSFKSGLNEYLDKHRAITNDLEKFKEEFGAEWKREFFKYCFGSYPKNGVELREGAMTIYFMCDDLRDYALACNQSEEEAAKGFGCKKSLLDDQPEELRGTIILEYSGHPKYKENALNMRLEKSKRTELHEEQHIIFDMLDDELNYEALNFGGLNEMSTLQEVKLAVNKYLNLRREELERGAKNEIIAYWRAGEKSWTK